MGPSRKPAPGSMARGAIRERTMRSLRATRDPRHAELPSRKHRNALPNARISDSQSCVESDTPRRRRASGGRYREWPHPRSGIRGWDNHASWQEDLHIRASSEAGTLPERACRPGRRDACAYARSGGPEWGWQRAVPACRDPSDAYRHPRSLRTPRSCRGA
jgi:hypothetical protein